MTPVCVSVAAVARELASIRRLGRRRARPGHSPRRFGRAPATPVPAQCRCSSTTLHLSRKPVGGPERPHLRDARPRRRQRCRPRARPYNALRSYLPELLALGANSPLYCSEDCGLATVRAKLNQSWPRAGVPPAFASWTELSELAGWARYGGAFPDSTHQWWDLRLRAGRTARGGRRRHADSRRRRGHADRVRPEPRLRACRPLRRGRATPVHREERSRQERLACHAPTASAAT